MYRRRISYQTGGGGPFRSMGAVILLVLFFVALFFIAEGIFRILYWISPILVILTLIMDYKVVTGYLKWVWNLLQRSPLFGIGAALLTIFGFPVVVGFLFAKALLKRKFNQARNEFEDKQQGKYIEFEEMESTPRPRKDTTSRIEIPVSKEEKKQDNQYDHLFDEEEERN